MKYLLVILILAAVAYSCNSSKNAGYKDINVDEFKTLMNKDNVVLLDVRTPEETAEGMIASAQEIDFKANDFESKIEKLDRDKTYLVYLQKWWS